MKEINIAKAIIEKRKEKGITQDELAAYIGVSKASVSKWETGQSYPDITFLPQLATYFNISIDELIGYSPQMTKEDIKKLYHRLSAEFSSKPFDEVLEECHSIIKKYYSCFPLLLQMAVLLINHHMLVNNKDMQNEILSEVISLCKRIKEEGGDVWLSKQANILEASCHLVLQQPDEILELLDGTLKPIGDGEGILANAYMMKGNMQKAKEVLQISTYCNLLSMVNNSAILLVLYQNEKDKFDEILHRMLSVVKLFDINHLHPNVALQLYLAAAQGYTIQGNQDMALDMIENYSLICTTNFFPFTLHGDSFFDCIDDWFKEFDLGVKAPRDEKVIKESMLQGIILNPVFAALADHPRYKSIIEAMKTKLGGNLYE